jgi:hypothetical protein
LVLYAMLILAMMIPSLMIGHLIGAGVVHLMLMMVGGARRSYEATLKALCYSYGACVALNVIPLAGLLVIVIMPIVSVIAIARTHGISIGKACIAFLLPFLPFAALVVLACGLNILGVLANLARLAGRGG